MRNHTVYTPNRGRYDVTVIHSPDTSLKVEKALFEIYKKLGPERRFEIGVELSDNMRDIAYSGFQAANPTLTRNELQGRFLERVLGWQLQPQIKGAITDHES